MALVKELDTQFGVPASYWRIGMIQVDFNAGTTRVGLLGYADEAARRAGAKPLAGRQAEIDSALGDRGVIYGKIKEAELFSDAQDA
jgi:hypothetical protein